MTLPVTVKVPPTVAGAFTVNVDLDPSPEPTAGCDCNDPPVLLALAKSAFCPVVRPLSSLTVMVHVAVPPAVASTDVCFGGRVCTRALE